MAKKPIKVTEVVLRDAHQSLLATRMTMDEMRPILPEMDKINYFSVECWGGATFDSCIRFLDEDPWERLRILRKELPHQKLQMLFRGQNMLGYRPYADDAVEYFVQKSVANGIDVIRIFDALNDPRNLQTAIKAANKEGAHVQGCISYTLSPVHNNEYFAAYAKTLEEMGANSICIKDMAGLLTPYTCYDLVKKLKETVSIPVDIHSHYTAGLASMSILKGIEAGADIIDTAMSPLSLGTSHMPTESLVAALQGTDYDTGLDLKQLNVVRAYFAKLREKYIANGQISPKSLGVDANTLLYQVPGGMFSNMLKQLKDAGKEDKLDEVLAEIPRVREDAGYPPLVTPTSQIVGTQAVFNVILGERYKMVTKEFKGLVHGDYGKTPAPIKPEFTKKILGDEQPITCRFADTLAPEMDKLKAEAAKWATQEEDVLTYAMFPQVAPKFFEKRNAKKQGVDANTLLYQVPGGMFSNMLKQLKDAGKEDKLDEVLAEIPRVREDAGYPPLVTPTSQIVGTQAVFNVILGERYKMVTKEFKGLVHGDYGKTPAPIKPEFTKKILGDEQPITCRFADTLAPEMDKLKAEAAKWATQEEDVLTYAMFPQVAPKFFEKRNAKKQGVDADHADYTNQSHPV